MKGKKRFNKKCRLYTPLLTSMPKERESFKHKPQVYEN